MVPGGGNFVDFSKLVAIDIAADAVLLPADPDRVIVVTSTVGVPATNIRLKFMGGATPFRVQTTKNDVELFSWKDHGPLVQREIRLEADAAGGDVYVYWACYRRN